MARNLAGGIAPGTERAFVPQSGGNAEDPDPIVVWFRQPTEKDRRWIIGDVRIANGETQSTLRDQQAWIEKAVLRFVASIDGYGGADGQPIDTAERLVEHGETEILAEVGQAILTSMEMSDAEKKHFAVRGGSTRATTLRSAGTAASADPAGSTSSEVAA